jgi:hypothetical protein
VFQPGVTRGRKWNETFRGRAPLRRNSQKGRLHALLSRERCRCFYLTTQNRREVTAARQQLGLDSPTAEGLARHSHPSVLSLVPKRRGAEQLMGREVGWTIVGTWRIAEIAAPLCDVSGLPTLTRVRVVVFLNTQERSESLGFGKGWLLKQDSPYTRLV